jgi:hypothetical protein
LIYRLATMADADACNRFYNGYHGLDRTAAEWKWEFVDPAGGSPLYAVIARDGEMLGLQAAIPIKMIDEHGVFMTAKSEDTLLDLEAVVQNKGAFADLFSKLQGPMADREVRVCWGFTAKTRAFKRLGFEVPFTTNQLVYCSSPQFFELASPKVGRPNGAKGFAYRWVARAAAGYASARTSLSGSSGTEIKRMIQAPDSAERVTESFVKTWGGATIYRDAEFLSWRHFDNPHLRAVLLGAYLDDTLLGWVTFSVDSNSIGYIVDLIVGHDDLTRSEAEKVAGHLLKEAVRHLRGIGVYGIRCWTLNDHPFDLAVRRQAQRLGFLLIRKGEPMVVRNESARPVGNPPPSTWYINRLFTDGSSG